MDVNASSSVGVVDGGNNTGVIVGVIVLIVVVVLVVALVIAFRKRYV